ncbi:MAG: M23 family metallopeptidase [Deltaproteobacteria bacterium]|nr:M23 family metallopeptidase [Deltaproteobacteria bacterium]
MRALTLLLVLSSLGCPTAPAADDDDDATEPVDDRLLFAFPVAEAWLIESVVGYDHDPEVFDDNPLAAANCTNYAGDGFPACYDEHDGSDFILEGAFTTMDDGSATVVAAAPGTVVSIEQDQYDRCHATFEGVSCDGNPIIGNHVILEHDDGTRTKYWHLMRDSVLVELGDDVSCGAELGLIGSSGNSSTPHLHFEVEVQPDGAAVDPYAGPESQPVSWWREQDGPFALPGPSCE